MRHALELAWTAFLIGALVWPFIGSVLMAVDFDPFPRRLVCALRGHRTTASVHRNRLDRSIVMLRFSCNRCGIECTTARDLLR